MSKLPFELFLALRYLRPKRTFVSIITLISILGVALGVAVLIIVISVMSGFDHDLRDKILGFNAHLTVTQARTQHDEKLSRTCADSYRPNKNVRGVSPFVLGRCWWKRRATRTVRQSFRTRRVLRGVDPRTRRQGQRAAAQASLPGEFRLERARHGGRRGFCQTTCICRSAIIFPFIPPREIKKMKAAYDRKRNAEAILPDDYEVRGIFDAGYYEYDAHVIVTSLENAQDLYDLDDSVHGLFVMLNDPYQAALVKGAVAAIARRQLRRHHLDGAKFRHSQRADRREKRDVLPAVFHRAGRGAVHLERANHLRHPEDARDRDAQGARRDQAANLRHFSVPKRHHRRHRRGVRLRPGHVGGDLSQ